MTRANIASQLSRAAAAMPPAERRAFRKFLASLPGAKPKRRKVHSWHRKAKARRTPKARRQGELPLA